MADETLSTTVARPPRAMGLAAAASLLATAVIIVVLSTAALALALALDMAVAFALVGFGVVASLALAAWAGQRLAAPLTRMAEQAEALRALDASKPIQAPTGVAELDRLGTALGRMKQALGVFAVYVPRDLVRQLIARTSEAQLGGERRPITVMFSDVADFTRTAEHLDPEQLMQMTCTYFEAVTSELLRNHATIDKYIGDAVMALWNAPRRDLSHARHACYGVLRARHVTQRLAAEFAARGWPQFHTRFGLHTGEAVVGNVGSSDRMAYTAIGSVVNLASRLEGLNKFHHTQILVSEATWRGAGQSFVFRPVGLVIPKGAKDAIEVFELLGLATAHDPDDAPLLADPAIVAGLPDWREMLLCFRGRRFDAAEAALRRAGRPESDAVAASYAERIAQLRAEPPGAEWSPVISFAEK
ncbi:MAG: adenylate/guanylate cyclase domain-containing protein [Pseudomonadota bacterium]